jgi:hypothetical protein
MSFQTFSSLGKWDAFIFLKDVGVDGGAPLYCKGDYNSDRRQYLKEIETHYSDYHRESVEERSRVVSSVEELVIKIYHF